MMLLPPKLRRIAGRMRDRLGPRAAVLLYHRVSDTPTDPYLLRVRTRHFQEQMDVLARRGRVIPLRALAAHHRLGSLPHGAVAITFDDGYIDNLLVAKPILQKHGLSATVFMTAGTIGREREFWWDELERVLLPLPGTPGRGQGRGASPSSRYSGERAGRGARAGPVVTRPLSWFGALLEVGDESPSQRSRFVSDVRMTLLRTKRTKRYGLRANPSPQPSPRSTGKRG